MSGFSDAGGFPGLGGAVTDLFGGIAGLDEAGAYGKAGKIASQNAELTQVATNIQEAQLQRQAYQTISAQKAEVGGAGFAAGGSAGDLLRSSVQQQHLASGLVATQGEITKQGYEQQAAAYQGQAAAAQAKAGGGIMGAIMKIAPYVLGALA